MGPRKVDPSVFGGSKGPRAKREGVVHVNSTANNTHLVLTDRASKVETWVSGGTVGYKNANKVQSGVLLFIHCGVVQLLEAAAVAGIRSRASKAVISVRTRKRRCSADCLLRLGQLVIIAGDADGS